MHTSRPYIALIVSFLLPFCLSWQCEVQAQQSFPMRFLAGGSAGASLSNVIFIPSVQQEYKWGVETGGILRVDVESYAGISMELNYAMRGWRERPTEEGGYTYERTLRMLSVPIFTHFMIGGGPLKLTIDAGPQFGLFLGESSHGTYPPEGIKGVETHQHEMGVEHKFLWGLSGGPGVEYHFTRAVAGLRAGYYYGLGDLYRNSRKDYFGKSSEQVFSLKAYLLFRF